jgi:2-octaprenyl-6-methoxyphenol hydroxylase
MSPTAPHSHTAGDPAAAPATAVAVDAGTPEANAVASANTAVAADGVHPILIVGGGLVGASLAIALGRIGQPATLLEASDAAGLPPVFDQRNLSLAEASVRALTALDVLPRLRAPGGPIARIHISRRGDFGRVLLDAADYDRAAFGQVVVARDFGAALEERLALTPGLTRLRPACFVGLEADTGDGLRRVRIADGAGERVLCARLLVAADGSQSAVRTALGISATLHDYRQTLFVARLRAARAPDGTAYERLTEDGPTALLPRGDGHYGLIHGVGAHAADAVAALNDADFLARIQDVFGWRAGRFEHIGPRSAYPIVGAVAERLHAHRAVLVGNAAQSLHPIGAQGFNLGLRDALTLVECIAAARDADGDAALGSEAMLAGYARRRREDRERTLDFAHRLARWSADPFPLLSPLRSLALFAIDHESALRAQLVAGAMGYRGDVPHLCREVAA